MIVVGSTITCPVACATQCIAGSLFVNQNAQTNNRWTKQQPGEVKHITRRMHEVAQHPSAGRLMKCMVVGDANMGKSSINEQMQL
jgi:hypothetical protein